MNKREILMYNVLLSLYSAITFVLPRNCTLFWVHLHSNAPSIQHFDSAAYLESQHSRLAHDYPNGTGSKFGEEIQHSNTCSVPTSLVI